MHGVVGADLEQDEVGILARHHPGLRQEISQHRAPDTESLNAVIEPGNVPSNRSLTL